jgi:hypothetical protein
VTPFRVFGSGVGREVMLEHHEWRRTPSGSPERAPCGSCFQPARGFANARRWVGIAFAFAPAERAGNAITMGYYQ